MRRYNNNGNGNSIKMNSINKDKKKNNNENIHTLNAFSDMAQNKKIKKYKTNENTLFFRNKEIKIKKLNIAELANINNIKKTTQNSKNQICETHKNENENKIIKKYNTNLYTETIKNSKSDNVKKRGKPKKTEVKDNKEKNNNKNKEEKTIKTVASKKRGRPRKVAVEK